MKRTFLSKHRRKLSTKHYQRRQATAKKIDNQFLKRTNRFRTIETSVTKASRVHELRSSGYSTQRVLVTLHCMVLIWYSKKIGTCSFMTVRDSDVIHTSFSFSPDYDFDVERVAVDFGEYVHITYTEMGC